MKHYSPNWQKESWQTVEEISGYVRPEMGQQEAQFRDRYVMMMIFLF